MLNIILQILSVIGILLLVLLILALVLILLVLFFPITYKFQGAKQEEISLKARANWLFGVLRVRYTYPQSGKLTVKLLWFTLYETAIPGGEKKDEAANEDSGDVTAGHKQKGKKIAKESTQAVSEPTEKDELTTNPQTAENVLPETETNEQVAVTGMVDEEDADTGRNKILKKIEEIKYTIGNICDKIKEVWENIHYYAEVLQDEQTKQLFHHVCLRLGNILKSIRPRHLKADILYGTGSPDTTGYVYGGYGMLSAFLGPQFIVTPDFEQAVLKGELQFAGHITVWVLLINALKLLLDKKLHLFIKKIKAGKKAQSAQKEDNK